MYIIGIDFSMNSTAMCVREIENDNCSFFWFPRKEKDKKDKKDKFNLKDFLEIYYYENSNEKETSFEDRQLNHIKNAHNLGNNIIKVINKYASKGRCQVVIEGFSFGSISQAYIDIVVYQAVFRSILVQNNLNFIPISPSEIKKVFFGKGNAKKEDMGKKILEIENKCLDFIKKEVEISLLREKIDKPFDDLVDAFAITEVFLKTKKT